MEGGNGKRKMKWECWQLSIAYDIGLCWDPLPLSQESVRTKEGSEGDVITKFARLDGLPIFLTHGASLAHFAPWSFATEQMHDNMESIC